VIHHIIPLKCRAWIDLVFLDVIMAQQTLIVIEVVIRQFVSDEMALGVTRVIAVDLWKGLAAQV